jgi:hypothetical protein
MVVGFLLTLNAPTILWEDMNDPRVIGHVLVTVQIIEILEAPKN